MFDLYRAEDLINQQEILITLIQNKMKDEYIIINKTTIQKRIEELENKQKDLEKLSHNPIATFNALQRDINNLKQILSQSTPLIPEIENAFNQGKEYGIGDSLVNKKEYISNLKLDI